MNPFRYRSYYYDNETELYYLKSRYYNPKTGRFISKDNINYIEPKTVNGLNLYNYCFNNPITYIDPDGTFSIVGLVIGALIGAAVGFGITAYEDYKDDGKVFNGSIGWQTYLGAGVGGAISGGCGSSSKALLRLTGVMLGSIVQGVIAENDQYNLESFKRDCIIGMASFGISEGLTIIGKKLFQSWFKKVVSNTTKKASKQLYQILNGKIVNNLTSNTQKILEKATIFYNVLSFGKETFGALYSFITSILHSTIIDW